LGAKLLNLLPVNSIPISYLISGSGWALRAKRMTGTTYITMSKQNRTLF